jgi:hypothetical protein
VYEGGAAEAGDGGSDVLWPLLYLCNLTSVCLRTKPVGDGDSDVLWPLLLLYQQHQHSDFLRQCAQESTIQDHLSEVMLNYLCLYANYSSVYRESTIQDHLSEVMID